MILHGERLIQSGGKRMLLLDSSFRIPAFSRIIWTSAAARKRYADLISRASALVQELEVLAVASKQRRCAWQQVPEKDFVWLSTRWLSMGLSVLPVKLVGASQGFAHYHEPPSKEGPNNVCVIIAQKYSDAVDYRLAFEMGDHEKQGFFLGFPECCSKFFARSWADGYIDPIWQSALASEISEKEDKRLRIKKHPYSNSMLRYIGIRFGFHIACSFACKETIAQISERIKLVGAKEVLKVFEDLLSMPMSWDCLAGVAIIRTPIFQILTSSNRSADRYLVEADGDFIPENASRGCVWPYTIEVKK